MYPLLTTGRTLGGALAASCVLFRHHDRTGYRVHICHYGQVYRGSIPGFGRQTIMYTRPTLFGLEGMTTEPICGFYSCHLSACFCPVVAKRRRPPTLSQLIEAAVRAHRQRAQSLQSCERSTNSGRGTDGSKANGMVLCWELPSARSTRHQRPPLSYFVLGLWYCCSGDLNKLGFI